VKEPPPGFDFALLQDALEQFWHLSIRQLEYCPVGFGAHHWRASTDSGDLFLSLHELDLVGRGGSDRAVNFMLLERTLSTAKWLSRLAGLEFVVGPLQDRSGQVIRSLANRFVLSVYGWLDAEPIVDPDGARTAEIIARLHTVSSELPAGLAAAEDFAIPHRGALEDTLANLDTTPGGPGPMPRLLERNSSSMPRAFDRSCVSTIS
jgi:spectinomycin phosphotransferase